MAADKRELLRSLEIDRDRSTAPSPRRRWPTVLAVLLVAIPATVAIIWLMAPDAFFRARVAETKAATTTPAPVMPPAIPEAGGRSLVASGYVVARRKATVAAEVTGKVIEVNVEEGKVVAQGQVLARLDSVLAEADLELARSRQAGAEAAVQSVVADLRDAEQGLSRTQSLSRREFATAADLIKAESRVGMLRAQLQKARAEAWTARLDVGRAGEVMEKHSIRAPFAGVVVEKSAQPGEMISPLSAGGGFTRTGICTIVDMASIEVEVDVNEAFIGRIRDLRGGGRAGCGGCVLPRLKHFKRRLRSMSTAPLIRLIGLGKRFTKGRETISIFDHLDMAIAESDFVAIMGPSGSGKTTLLNLLGGIDRPSAGEIHVDGTRIEGLSEGQLARWRAANVGFVFQFYNLMPMLTAQQNVELPLLLTTLKAPERRKRVAAALEIVNLADRAKHYPREMSGGQQQRVAIARAIVSDPKLLLCDEPTGDLDRGMADEILSILQLLNRELGKTIIMVTHDPAAAKYAGRILHLDKGRFSDQDLAA